MRQKKITYTLIIVFLIPALILTSRYFAIKNTIQECNIFHIIQVEPIQDIDIEFYLIKFLPDRNPNSHVIQSHFPYLPVWLITMEGTWSTFGIPTEPGQPEIPTERFETCGSVVNFFTTQTLGIFAR